MLAKIRSNTSSRQAIRINKKIRIRKKIAQNRNNVARLVIYRSNQFLYAQVIDDGKSLTMAQANTKEEAFKSLKSRKNLEAATQLGKLIGQRAKEKKVENVLFDRNGYDYHGRVKAIAEGAREAGLKF
jgi:large subunit ribosomal protein L18